MRLQHLHIAVRDKYSKQRQKKDIAHITEEQQ